MARHNGQREVKNVFYCVSTHHVVFSRFCYKYHKNRISIKHIQKRINKVHIPRTYP